MVRVFGLRATKLETWHSTQELVAYFSQSFSLRPPESFEFRPERGPIGAVLRLFSPGL